MVSVITAFQCWLYNSLIIFFGILGDLRIMEVSYLIADIIDASTSFMRWLRQYIREVLSEM